MIDESETDYISDRLAQQGETLAEMKNSIDGLVGVLTQAFAAPQARQASPQPAPQPVQRNLRPTNSARFIPRPQPTAADKERAERLFLGQVDETSEFPEAPNAQMGLLATTAPVGDANPHAKEEAIYAKFGFLEAQIELLTNKIRVHEEALKRMHAEFMNRSHNTMPGVTF